MLRARTVTPTMLLLATATAGGAQAQIADPVPAPIEKGPFAIELQLVADNLTAPNLLTTAPGDPDRLFVVDQAGQVQLIKNGALQSTPYLDASGLLVELGGIIPTAPQTPFLDFDERGLLGLAFHPGFHDPQSPGHGKIYTYTSEPVNGPADFTVPLPDGESFNHQSVVREWTVDPNADTVTGDPASISRVVMTIDEPQFNHNAGDLRFGPDGHLYIGVGDGGNADDQGPGHSPQGNGQDPTNVLGTLLRIDPLGTNRGTYGVPDDNPFAATDGPELDEIFAYGLRNPFRFSFDVDPATGQPDGDATGRLIVADVGQNDIEEVNIVTEPGQNFGWRIKEGTFLFDTGGPFDPDNDPDGFVTADSPGSPEGLVDPVLQYDHDEGLSVIGGHVYRGDAIPELKGWYIFGDFSRDFFGPDGRLFAGNLETGEIVELVIGFDDRNLDLFVKGFGVDHEGEIFVLSGINLGPFRDEEGNGFGQVLKIVPVPEPATLTWCALAAIPGLRRRSPRP